MSRLGTSHVSTADGEGKAPRVCKMSSSTALLWKTFFLSTVQGVLDDELINF